MKSSTTLVLSSYMVALVVSACGAAPKHPSHREVDAGSGGNPSVTADAGTSPPPLRVDGAPPCVFSADCPDGQHCDLGECVQSCNADSACAKGLVCSPRARCLPKAAPDEDPPPVTKKVGTVTADPVSVVLTDRDDTLKIHLKADTEDPVRYRVQLSAPHLSIAQPRGEFQGDTELDLPVNTTHLAGTQVPGTVKIFTTLGDLVVDAPIQVGITGAYQGAMTYDGGDIQLGSVGLGLALSESNGDVLVQVDPDRSLLFPKGDAGPVSGEGTFTLSEGVEFTLKDVRSHDFGGTRNHFHRPLGRVATFKLAPSDRGTLQGTFEEKLYGLFQEPVTLSGTIYLERRPLDDSKTISVPEPPAMPTVSAASPPTLGSVFSNWADNDCVSIKNTVQAPTAADAKSLSDEATLIDVQNYLPLAQILSGDAPASVSDTASICQTELAETADTAKATAVPQCAIVPRLACALRDIAASTPLGTNVSDAFSSLFAHTLDPALLVAQDDIVNSVKDSFVHGLAAELSGLGRARDVLDAPTTWVLEPGIIDYLSRVPSFGSATVGSSGEPRYVEALRTLSRLFYVLSTIDGETSNISAADRVATQTARVLAAQERGVLTLFEAGSIIGVLQGWGQSAPPNVGTEFTNVLSPMDRGFSTLVQGALVFGVPDGFIPILNKPGDTTTSNFEAITTATAPQLSQLQADETAFQGANRTYEQNADTLGQELLSVQTGIDSELADLCGPDFDVKSVKTDADWAGCGANNAGEVGSLLLGIDQAQEKLRDSHGRITGMGQKIKIEYGRIADVKQVRDGTIQFVDQTGDQLDALTVTEGQINVAEKALEMASNSSLLNAGAPVGMAVVEGMLEEERTTINVQRQDLQTAQEVRIQGDNSLVEVINGMATIQGLMVDMAQLNLEMNQDVLGVLQSEISVTNAIDRAKGLANDRASTALHIQTSPFNDPTFRILEDRAALQAIHSREDAQHGLYLAGRALEYQLNQSLGDALGKAVFNVFDSSQADRLANCLKTIATEAAINGGTPQDYTTEFSVRKALGITDSRLDPITGASLSAGEQFRELLLQNENLDGEGGVGIQFSSNLDPGNQLWPSNVCDDKISTVEAQLVGDFLGDNDAQVELSLAGGGVLRRCDLAELVNWSTTGNAVVQAGVNTYGTAAPNASLRGLSVASAEWKVAIPGPQTAPSNADVDLAKVDDIVLRVHHTALPVNAAASPAALDCLSSVGAGL